MSQFPRLQMLSGLAWLLLALLISVQGCDCGSTGADVQRYACTQDNECASGFLCRDGECRPEGEPLDAGPDAGPDAGGPDAGPDGGRPDAGPDGGTVGGTDGGTDGGTPDAGPTTRPTKLTFISPPQTVEAGQCSAAVVIETQDSTSTAAPVAAQTTVTLSAQGNSSVSFYFSATCTGAPTSSGALLAGSSRLTVYFRGTAAQSVRLAAAAPGLTSATQDNTVSPAPPSIVAVLTPSQTLPAGGCSSRVDLAARDAYGNLSPFPAQTAVALGGGDGSGFLFFSNAGCTSQIPQVAFAAGASSTSFYFKGRTGGTFNIFATASGLPSASQSETILPVVRTGTCTIALGEDSVTCPITPAQLDLSKTFLMFQTGSNDPNPDSASVRCALRTLNTITCTRNDSDDGDEPPVVIRWQTAELVSGLRVQHLEADCNEPDTLISVPIPSDVNVQNTFLLVSAESDGNTYGDDNFYTAWLDAPDLVELWFYEDCDSEFVASIQVVEFTGASVTRGFTQPIFGATRNVGGLSSVNINTTALLFTYQSTAWETEVLCDRAVRGELSSATSLSFTRGSNAAACTDEAVETVFWERIDFGSRAWAQHFAVSMAAGTASTSITLPEAVDPTRTLVFASGQAQSGQGGGDSTYTGDDLIGASLGVHALTSPTSLTVGRGSSLGTARWYSTVLQLEP